MGPLIRRLLLLVTLAPGALAPAALAADLRVGIRADPTMDPHVNYLAPNIAVARHLFEPLVVLDDDERPVPALAESWRLVNEKEWEFKLRPGVRFSDGTPSSPTTCCSPSPASATFRTTRNPTSPASAASSAPPPLMTAPSASPPTCPTPCCRSSSASSPSSRAS